MKRRVMGGALVLAFVTLGCQTAIDNMPKTDQQARETRYSLLSLGGLTVTASSIENSYYAAEKVLDGNLTSAWAPLFSDASPTLTLNLGGARVVTSLAIKASPAGAKVDVAVLNGATYETIATGLVLNSGVLTNLDVPDRTTSSVRLTFSGVPAADLFVCETQVEGSVPTPTPAPTPTPTPTPRPPCDCKVTGGGWVYKLGPNNIDKVTFGLVAMDDKSGGAKGVIEVNDHITKKKYHGNVDRIVCDNNNLTVTFSGKLRNGAAFTTVVTDYDEPGKDDAFSFSTAGFSISGLLGDDDGGGGNIQVHRDNCP